MRKINTHDVIKAIAMLSMISDHLGAYFLRDMPYLRLFGEIAAPMYFFVAGLHVTKIRYDFLLLGIVITYVTYLTFGFVYFNILVSFFIIRVVMILLEKYLNPTLLMLLIPILLATNIPVKNNMEYGNVGLCFALSALFMEKNLKFGKIGALVTLLYQIILVIFFRPRGYNVLRDINYGDYLPLIFMLLCYLIPIYFFAFYKNKEYNLPIVLKEGTYVFSRFSLEIYVYHLILFKLFAALYMTYGQFS